MEGTICNPPQEELERENFIKNNERILWEIAEEAERKKQEEEERKAAKEARLKEIKEKLESVKNSRYISSYEELKRQLKIRIGLTQPQQMDLWRNYMLRKIGPANSHLVWEIVEENNVTTYPELKRLLNERYY